ncbi:hypothetical protein [Photobacterium sp.]|uniref:hypothetical protein n=1 Tax=Photobacterium sp. TaxID=660 RepID=UPI00299D60B0|nr:hypothetical protein [Photobacterium sp.]MDX1302847.1 hypothetical protein [Photobacterium sp.]
MFGLRTSGRDGASSGIFLIGFGLLYLTGWWWPGLLILLAVTGLADIIMSGNWKDAAKTAVVFVIAGAALWALVWTGMMWSILIPGTLIVAGIFLVYRGLK